MENKKICSFDVGILNLAYCIIETNNNNSDFNILKWDIINISCQDKKEKLTCCFKINNRKCAAPATTFFYDKLLKENKKNGLCKNHKKEYYNILFNKYYTNNNDNNKLCTYIKCKLSCVYLDVINPTQFFCEKHCRQQLKINKLEKIKKNNANTESKFNLAMTLYKKLDEIPEMLTCESIIIENQPAMKNPIMKNIGSLIFGYFMLRGVIDNNIKHIKLMSPLNKLKIDENITKTVLKQCAKDTDIKKMTKKLGIIYTKVILNSKPEQFILLKPHKKQDDLCDAFLQGYYYLYHGTNFNFDQNLYHNLTNEKKLVIE